MLTGALQYQGFAQDRTGEMEEEPSQKTFKKGRHRRTDSPEDVGGMRRQRTANGCRGGKPAGGDGSGPG